MGRKRDRKGKLFYLYLAVIVMAIQVLGGCATIRWSLEGKQELEDAKQMAMRGESDAALKKYEQIGREYPQMGDQALFWTAVLYIQPGAGKGDYRKSLEGFQGVIDKYPKSGLREEAVVMAALIKEMLASQQKIGTWQKKTDASERKADAWERKAETLQKQIEKMKQIDQDVERKKRRLRPVR